MTYEVKLFQAASQHLAVVRRKTSRSSLSQVIPGAFDEVWDFLRATETRHNGINVVVYHHDHDDIFDIECGAQVLQPFEPSSSVIAVSTPAGLTATTTHVGPYDRLPEAHAAVHAWCRAHAKSLEGTSWEVYDHWEEDTSKLRTSIFYLLRG